MTVRGKPRHGTYRGYQAHQDRRTGSWTWPPCAKCRAAYHVYELEYRARPGVREGRRNRARARQSALCQLSHVHPGQYRLLYAKALADEGLEEGHRRAVPEVPVWDDVIARLVRAALGRDEPVVAERVREGQATRQEREVHRLVSRLRAILGQQPRP